MGGVAIGLAPWVGIFTARLIAGPWGRGWRAVPLIAPPDRERASSVRFSRRATPRGTGQYPERTSGPMARFSVLQRKARPRDGIGLKGQATRRSSVSAGLLMMRRNSAATPSSTARFSFIRFEWL